MCEGWPWCLQEPGPEAQMHSSAPPSQKWPWVSSAPLCLSIFKWKIIIADPFALWGDLRPQPNGTGTWKGFDSLSEAPSSQSCTGFSFPPLRPLGPNWVLHFHLLSLMDNKFGNDKSKCFLLSNSTSGKNFGPGAFWEGCMETPCGTPNMDISVPIDAGQLSQRHHCFSF